MKIYAVNSETCSAYRVVALFSTKKKAHDFMEAVKDDYNGIEEYDLDPKTTDLLKRGYSVWYVHMLIDGNTERVEKTDNDRYYIECAGSHEIWRRSQAPAYKGKGIPDILTSYVWAKTEKAAIKIVNEHRTMMIASGKWK